MTPAPADPPGVLAELGLLRNVHPADRCAGRACVIHNPSDHHMRGWPVQYRRGIVERTCPHGVGHPDPDQVPYWAETGRDYEGIHCCDGCCSGPRPAGTGATR